MTGPITFRPLFMERVWGGRRLAERFGKPLPADVPIGESWELVDREEAQSVVEDGPLGGLSLHELWREHRPLFGAAGAVSADERFPLLVKLIDAAERLSIQVHPPADAAAELGGEPKSEAWVIVDVDEGAHLLAGLRRGADRARFEAALEDGDDLVELLHRIDVRPGDALMVPSGRVHGIGPGTLIAEFQQNSDTTFRVYDFGRPRDLHVQESLRSIDFADVEPALATDDPIACEHFTLHRARLDGSAHAAPAGEASIVAVLRGEIACGGRTFGAGRFFLLPATGDSEIRGQADVAIATLPGASPHWRIG